MGRQKSGSDGKHAGTVRAGKNGALVDFSPLASIVVPDDAAGMQVAIRNMFFLVMASVCLAWYWLQASWSTLGYIAVLSCLNNAVTWRIGEDVIADLLFVMLAISFAWYREGVACGILAGVGLYFSDFAGMCQYPAEALEKNVEQVRGIHDQLHAGAQAKRDRFELAELRDQRVVKKHLSRAERRQLERSRSGRQ